MSEESPTKAFKHIPNAGLCLVMIMIQGYVTDFMPTVFTWISDFCRRHHQKAAVERRPPEPSVFHICQVRGGVIQADLHSRYGFLSNEQHNL